MQTACEIYAQGNTGKTFFKSIREYFSRNYTAQPEEPDKDDFEEKFEPMDITKLPHLYTVSDIQIALVLREAVSGNPIFAVGMLKTLEILGLLS